MSSEPSFVPRCFSSEQQFLTWKASAERIEPGDSDFCTDCTPEFQSERIREFRCAHPGTTFHIGVDGFYEGVRPLVRLPNRPREDQPRTDQAHTDEPPKVRPGAKRPRANLSRKGRPRSAAKGKK